MPKIYHMEEAHSIKVGPDSTVLPDGTIVDPVPYEAVTIGFDDGVECQVERPLTVEKIQDAYHKALHNPHRTIDGISVHDNIPPEDDE